MHSSRWQFKFSDISCYGQASLWPMRPFNILNSKHNAQNIAWDNAVYSLASNELFNMSGRHLLLNIKQNLSMTIAIDTPF